MLKIRSCQSRSFAERFESTPGCYEILSGRKTTLLLGIWLPLGAMTACSPYVYEHEVSAFATGVTAVGEAYTGGMGLLADDSRAFAYQAWLETQPSLSATGECRLRVGDQGRPSPGDRPCTLRAQGQEPPQPPPLVTDAESVERVQNILRHLTNYSGALAAITNAEDRQAYDVAAASLSNGISDLAALSGFPAAPAIAGAASGGLLWIIGAGFDQQRHDALETATQAAAQPITTLSKTLEEILDRLRTERSRVVVERLNLLGRGLGPQLSRAEYGARLAIAEQLVAELEALRQTDPIATATGLVRAHDALVAALQDDSRQADAVSAAVTDFLEHAQSLREALANFEP